MYKQNIYLLEREHFAVWLNAEEWVVRDISQNSHFDQMDIVTLAVTKFKHYMFANSLTYFFMPFLVKSWTGDLPTIDCATRWEALFFVWWGGSLFCERIFCGSPHLREEKSEGEEKMWVGGGKCGEGGAFWGRSIFSHQLTPHHFSLPQTRRTIDYLPTK